MSRFIWSGLYGVDHRSQSKTVDRFNVEHGGAVSSELLCRGELAVVRRRLLAPLTFELLRALAYICISINVLLGRDHHILLVIAGLAFAGVALWRLRWSLKYWFAVRNGYGKKARIQVDTTGVLTFLRSDNRKYSAYALGTHGSKFVPKLATGEIEAICFYNRGTNELCAVYACGIFLAVFGSV